MNAQMRLVIMLTSVAVSGSLLFAAEPATAPEPRAQAGDEQKATQKAPETAASKAAEKTPENAAENASAPSKPERGSDADQDPEPKRATSAADKAGSPQRFNPSEQVRADFDVSFPVDI